MTGPMSNAIHNPSGVNSMRRLSQVITCAMAIMGVVGCGESELESSSVPFKPTDTAQFESLKDQMKSSLNKKAYMKRPIPGKSKERSEGKAE
jgi:hypothetical protein